MTLPDETTIDGGSSRCLVGLGVEQLSVVVSTINAQRGKNFM
jgi:hypothetical protein